LSFSRSFIDSNASSTIYNNTAIINITYPTPIDDRLYKLEAKLLNENDNNITNVKIKDTSNVRELRVEELKLSSSYKLTVKLVNKSNNMKSTESNMITITIAPPPAIPARTTTASASAKKGGKSRKSARTIEVESIPLQNKKARTKRQRKKDS